jgi:hypothetical protein
MAQCGGTATPVGENGNAALSSGHRATLHSCCDARLVWHLIHRPLWVAEALAEIVAKSLTVWRRHNNRVQQTLSKSDAFQVHVSCAIWLVISTVRLSRRRP